ncbi:MAG: trypsin-like peptidase domain-containing protein, partial [Deltaproteobacteria bacterium]
DPGSPRISSTITTARLLGGQQFQIVGFGGPLNGTRPQKWIWDWAVIRLPRANRFNYPGVLNRRRQAAAGDGMYIVQHPAGRQRTIVWDTDVTPTGALVTAATPGSQACFAHPTRRCVQCTVASLDGATGGPGSMMRFLHYTCDTEGGSSGSPVMKLDAATTFTWELVGLHHGYDGTFNEAININLPSLVTAAF